MKIVILAIASILILSCATSLDTVASNQNSDSREKSRRDVSLDSILAKTREIRTQRAKVMKEGKFMDFNYEFIDSEVDLKDTLKFPAEEYYLVGFDSLDQVVKVSRYSNSSLNYDVEIFRDSLFAVMNVSNFWYDKTHDEKKGDYMKGCIIKYFEKFFFLFDSRVTHPLFENAFNLTSIMELDGHLKVKDIAYFNKGTLTSISHIQYDEYMEEGKSKCKFAGEDVFMYNEKFMIGGVTRITEISTLFSDYQNKSIKKETRKKIAIEEEYLDEPFWLHEGNHFYKE